MLRLSDQDPLLAEVYSSWAAQLEIEGNFEQSAKCFLAINQPLDAIRLLCKKGDPSSLRAGLEVAIFSHQETMATTLMARYVNECMKAFDWSQAQEVKSHSSLLQAGQLLLLVHETITASWLADEVIQPAWYEEPLWSPWQQKLMAGGREVFDDLGGWPCRVVDGAPALQAAIEWWANHHDVDFSNNDYIRSLYTWIQKTKPQGIGHNLSTKQLLINLSNEVILGQLCVYMGDIQQAATHWLEALVLCHNVGQYDMAKGLCTLILPKGRNSLEELKDKDCSEDRKQKPSIVISCLEAYYTLTSLYHLWWNFKLAPKDFDKGQSSPRSSETKSVLVQTEHKTDTMASTDNSFDKTDETKGNANDCTGQQNDNTPLSLVAKLKFMSRTLLSDEHVKHIQLQLKLSRIQQAVAKLVTQHSAQGRQQATEDKVGSVEMCELKEETMLASEETAASESDANIQSGSDNATRRLTEIHDKMACSSTDSVLSEEQLPDSLVDLTAALNDVLKEIELIPTELKECAFPDPFSSALTLLHFTTQVAKKSQVASDQEQLQQLRKTVAQFGYTHSCDKRSYFAKYL